MIGIDASKYQGDILWPSVKTNNPKIEFAFLKVSEGVGYTDPRIKVEAKEASDSGMNLGYYHFASLNKLDSVTDANQEADYFLSVVKTLPKPGMPLVLDIETNAGNIPKDKVLAYIKQFMSKIQQAGYEFALYSYTPFLNSNLPENHGLGSTKLWIAQYTNASRPNLPKGWASYWIWQYSSKGRVAGINANVDMNKTAF